jgi:uncharacterized membrane protein
MKSRLLLQIAVFAGLAALGAWLAHQALVTPGRVGGLNVDLGLAAMYWFGLLVYALIVLILYYPLRRRSWAMLLCGHGLAVVIALVSTATVVMLGQRQAPVSNQLPDESAEVGASLPPPIRQDTAEGYSQSLPLPPSADPKPRE